MFLALVVGSRASVLGQSHFIYRWHQKDSLGCVQLYLPCVADLSNDITDSVVQQISSKLRRYKIPRCCEMIFTIILLLIWPLKKKLKCFYGYHQPMLSKCVCLYVDFKSQPNIYRNFYKFQFHGLMKRFLLQLRRNKKKCK